MNFLQQLQKTARINNSFLCIGLDTDINKIPKHLLKTKDPVFDFNKSIIDNTHDLVCCYKLNVAYYSSLGVYGLQSLQKTIKYIHDHYTSISAILDAKRGDIGNTSEQYAKEVFDVLDADAVTVNPYLGFDALEPFFKHKDKGIIILCRTSNPGASDFQDTQVAIETHPKGGNIKFEPLYITVAKKIVEWDKKYGNCLMVVGATWPNELKKVRSIAKDMFFLIPGVGAQGGDLREILEFGLNKEKSGLIIHSARAIIYASNQKDFAQKAREKAQELKEEINAIRRK